MHQNNMGRILNAVGAYAGWWACLVGAAHGMPWAGPVVVAGLAAASAMRPGPRSERVAFLIVAAGTGYGVDSILVLAGVLVFPEHARLGGPSTLWMVALWVNLALTLDSSLGWLRGRFVLGATVGAVGGPLAYFSGAQLGAAVLGPTLPIAMAAVAVAWSIALPWLLWVADRTALARITGSKTPGRRHPAPHGP